MAIGAGGGAAGDGHFLAANGMDEGLVRKLAVPPKIVRIMSESIV